jgi:hypothetical protein
MRQYSQLFCLGLQIWISEMLQYHPELEVVELVRDGPRFFWDHLLPTAHVNSFLHDLAVSYKWWPLIVLEHRTMTNRSSPHLEQKRTQVRIMGITNCPMHNNDSIQCVGLVSTNQDNFLGPHKKHLLQIWISEMLQYYPELEVVELVQDGLRFFWDHLLPTAHVNSFLHYLAVVLHI